MAKKDSLGDRMKIYEATWNTYLPPRMPLILRLDGKAWHSLTKSCQKPFDEKLINALNKTAIRLCEEIQGAQIAFLQSDEISILIHNYKRLDSKSWFDNKLQKMLSVSAAIASSTMTLETINVFGKYRNAEFDSRAIIVPESDVCNLFYWRQKDWTRNSVQMVARSMYSQKECYGKNNSQLQDMIHAKGQNWNNLPVHLKRGRCVIKESYVVNGANRSRWVVDNNIPIFSKDREYIEKYLKTED